MILPNMLDEADWPEEAQRQVLGPTTIMSVRSWDPTRRQLCQKVA